jgi:hypothetical protein
MKSMICENSLEFVAYTELSATAIFTVDISFLLQDGRTQNAFSGKFSVSDRKSSYFRLTDTTQIRSTAH